MKALQKLFAINGHIEEITGESKALAIKYSDKIEKVHPRYSGNALNQIPYLAFRRFNIDELQEKLRASGLPDLAHIEGHVMKSLLAIKTIINHLSGNPAIENHKGIISIKKSEKLIHKNTQQIFGWKNFATIQEEILRICEAAHIPYVWATQVLENLVKKGVPTRSEITDAALAQRAECVMLNKGM